MNQALGNESNAIDFQVDLRAAARTDDNIVLHKRITSEARLFYRLEKK
jgi:hypothetical protein